MFFIIGVQNKFRNIRRATHVLESLLKNFNFNFIKKDTPAHVFSWKYCKIF